MPNVPGIPITGPDPTGLDIQVIAPVPEPATNIPGDGPASVELAWRRFMQRIGQHNVALYKAGGKALDSVETLMRSN